MAPDFYGFVPPTRRGIIFVLMMVNSTSQFLAKTMEVWQRQAGVELRGARRVAAFTEALEPVRAQMDPGEFEDLVLRLSMVTGIEQHIILDDILRVDHETGDRLQAGIVDALLEHYLPTD